MFEKQIESIKNDEVRAVLNKALSQISPLFYEEGASSTGKYHPDYAAGEGGLYRHVQAATNFAIMLLDISDVLSSNNDSYQKDIIIAALILHDSCKKGIDFSSRYTDFLHPLLVANLMDKAELSDEENKIWNDICFLISTHMGQWRVDSYHPEKVLPKIETKEQVFVHFCDYLASRKQINVKAFGVSLKDDEYYEKLEKMENGDILSYFNEELKTISNDHIRNITINALQNTNPAFMTASAGKYYPRAYNGYGGLARYVKTTVYIANLLLDMETTFLCDHDKDIIRAALLIHRCADKGVFWNAKGILANYPMLSRGLIDENMMDGESFILWDEINSMVETCKGKWNTIKGTNITLPLPTTGAQLFVHWCVYLASRDEFEFDIFIKDDEKKEKKFEPATEKQISAIQRITVKLEGLSVELPPDAKVDTAHLSKGQAGKIISLLKRLESELSE